MKFVDNCTILQIKWIKLSLSKLAQCFSVSVLDFIFRISNLGMFGIGEFSAVINPPQTAIMAVGSSRLVLGDDGKPQSRMTVTLSYDARVIDESEASQFLEVFRDTIENPQLLASGRSAAKRASILWRFLRLWHFGNCKMIIEKLCTRWFSFKVWVKSTQLKVCVTCNSVVARGSYVSGNCGSIL